MSQYDRELNVPGKSADELFEFMLNEIERFFEKNHMGKFELNPDRGSKIIHFRHTMLSAKLTCLDAKMILNVKLSLLARPFKSKLDGAIDQWFSRKLANPQS